MTPHSTARSRKIQKAVKSGQVRQFTGNDYSRLDGEGRRLGGVRLVGRHGSAARRQQVPAVRLSPKSGGGIWTDNMLIPKHGDAYLASVYMNFVYDPKIAAEIDGYVNYICAVLGADKVLAEDRSRRGEEPPDLPDAGDAEAVAPVRPEGALQPGLQAEVAEAAGSLSPAPPRARGSVLHRHRWLTPYLLLAPGLAFLALFFLVPLGFLGHQSLETQNPIDFTNSFNWAWHNYSDALTTYHTQLRPFVRVRGNRDRDRAPAQLSARVLDRVPRRTLEEPVPADDHRPILRHLPDPDARVGDDPGRPGAGRALSPLRAPDQRDRRQRPAARDADRGRRRYHLQLPAVHGAPALCLRWSRSTRG